MVHVLVSSAHDRQLISTPIEPNQTFKDLKTYVAQQQGLQSTEDLKVYVDGEEVSDQQQLSDTGVQGSSSSSKLTVQSASLQLFPNNWFEVHYTKTYAKVLDITWPPVRQADYIVGWSWVAAAAAAIIAVNTLLGT